MASIVHIMGPTCAGKSTLIDQLQQRSQDIYTVQIGKFLRMKYGAGHFGGQAAPLSTKQEAQDLYFEMINEGLSHGKKIILVDGQPRDLDQCRLMSQCWPDHKVSFLLVHAEFEVRKVRAQAGRAQGPELDLAIQRLNNDYANNYIVMAELLCQGLDIHAVNTGLVDFAIDDFCDSFLVRYK